MTRLTQVLLPCIGLSISTLGAVLPTLQTSVKSNVESEGSYGISWAQATPAPTSASAPSPSIGTRQVVAFPRTGDMRCLGNAEQIYDDSIGVWLTTRVCHECFTNEKGSINCIPDNNPPVAPVPVCKAGTRRCNVNTLELCDSNEWHQIEVCSECVTDLKGELFCAPLGSPIVSTVPPAPPSSTTSAPVITPTPAPTSVPAPSETAGTSLIPTATPTGSSEVPGPSPAGAVDPWCDGGSVRCAGDRMTLCTSSHKWEDFGPCPSCKQLYNTRVDCKYQDPAESLEMSALLSRAVDVAKNPLIHDCTTNETRCAEQNTAIDKCNFFGEWVRLQQCEPQEICVPLNSRTSLHDCVNVNGPAPHQ
ncbi:hypothetical protein M426DRAFT_13762 [Hypoxylon sp. CI-4A]|nr:hypothetical protein M426DRAFT_13762 [Hypoxylon sp. CI-4A]